MAGHVPRRRRRPQVPAAALHADRRHQRHAAGRRHAGAAGDLHGHRAAAQVGVPVDLPKTSAQQVGGKDEPLVVSLNSKDEVFLGDTKYELAELGAKLKAVHDEKPDQRVFVRGDKAINYGRMMEVMGVVIDSGFRQLGLLGEQAGRQAPVRRPPRASSQYRRTARSMSDRSFRCGDAHPGDPVGGRACRWRSWRRS